MRVEHEHHAKNHGKQVGANMAGADQPYDHLPFFYSDLFDLGYEAVGELDSRLEMVVDGDELGGQMTVYYVDGEAGLSRGILLWVSLRPRHLLFTRHDLERTSGSTRER